MKKFLSVKVLVTLMLTIVFSILTLTDRIDGNNFMAIYTAVVGFYFGKTTSEK